MYAWQENQDAQADSTAQREYYLSGVGEKASYMPLEVALSDEEKPEDNIEGYAAEATARVCMATAK